MNGKRSLLAYLRLFRAPNLLIIILTMVLLRYCIIGPFYAEFNIPFQLDTFQFILLMLSTLLVASGGYLVNDYYDIDIDDYNKKDNIVGLIISIDRMWLIYGILNLIATIIGFYLALVVGIMHIGFMFPVIAGLLYFYSSRYKGMLFWGNIIIAALSAIVVLIVWLFEFLALRNNVSLYIEVYKLLGNINTLVWSYAGFAFLVSLVRELIKDIQDSEGDRKFGCRTLPIILGIKLVKAIVLILTGITIALLGLGQYFLLIHSYDYAFWYLLIAVQTILIYLFLITVKSGSPDEYALPSMVAKVIMVAGILSMELICLNI